jgi:uncharacterized FlaG/YvyC family protein
MKIEEISKNIVNPPSAPSAIHISAKKVEILNSTLNSYENKDGSLEAISEEDQEAIQKLAEHINRFAKENQISLQFIPDKESGIVIIKVYDGQGKFIRQIPPEALMSLSAKIGKKNGILFNVKL